MNIDKCKKNFDIQRNIKLTRAVDVDINAILSAVSIPSSFFFQ